MFNAVGVLFCCNMRKQVVKSVLGTPSLNEFLILEIKIHKLYWSVNSSRSSFAIRRELYMVCDILTTRKMYSDTKSDMYHPAPICSTENFVLNNIQAIMFRTAENVHTETIWYFLRNTGYCMLNTQWMSHKYATPYWNRNSSYIRLQVIRSQVIHLQVIRLQVIRLHVIRLQVICLQVIRLHVIRLQLIRLQIYRGIVNVQTNKITYDLYGNTYRSYTLKRISNWPLYKIWYYATYLINASKVWLLCIVRTNLSINRKKKMSMYKTVHTER